MYAFVAKSGSAEYNVLSIFSEADMKSFQEYAKERETIPKESGESAEELTKKIAKAYNGKSNAEMLQSILREAEKSKRAGTLSNEEIESFYQNFSVMLNGAQRKKLREVVERLKEI